MIWRIDQTKKTERYLDYFWEKLFEAVKIPKEYFKSILEVNISMFVSKSVKKQENNPPEKL